MKIRFDPPEHRSPDRDQGVKVLYSETRRAAAKWRWYLVLLIVASPLIYFLATILEAILVVEADGYIQLEQIEIHAPVNGRIDKLHIRLQDSVTVNQPIIQISDLALTNRYRRLKDELDALTQEKRIAESTTSQNAIQSRHIFAIKQREYYEKRLRTYESLYRQGAATIAELNTARAEYEDALNTVSISALASQRLPTESRQRDLRLRSLNLEFAAASDLINLQLITAPKESKVADVFVHEGEYVSTGTPLARLVSQDQTSINGFLAPRYADYAVVGQSATVTFPNGDKKKAVISEIPELTSRLPGDASSVFSKRPVMILVKLEFDEPPLAPLPAGLPVKLRFHYNWE